MFRRLCHKLFVLRHALGELVTGPQAMAVLPAALLAGYWAGGQTALMMAAIIAPALLVLAGALDRRRHNGVIGLQASPAFVSGRSMEQALDAAIRTASRHDATTACLMLELENFDAVLKAQGADAASSLADHVAHRLRISLRRRDRVFFLGHGRFGIALAPMPSLTEQEALALARRIQDGLSVPAARGRPGRCFSTSIGICIGAGPGAETGADLISAASDALRDAREFAPSTIRVYSAAARQSRFGLRPLRLHDEALRALENGEIRAWFQPQICTDTGQVSGFEALARWCHPQRGIILPDKFLPYLQRAGKTGRLQAIMLRESLGAMAKWQAAGFDIPGIGVNFSPQDLRDPALADKVAWELDRHDMAPSRLTVEILETVVSVSPDDDVSRNVRRLTDLGCRIDLDDFGTGHASISSLKQFAVHRLKIDRSFVHRIDSDQEQQRMVAAILTMAEQLQLETLAEGVETAGEHALLAQLGCGHVQGFGIAKPMPFGQTLHWLRSHRTKLGSPPQIRHGTL